MTAAPPPPRSTPGGPPRPPRAVLRVGITGHRPVGLDEADFPALRAIVRAQLRRLREATIAAAATPESGYAAEAAELRIISPLAEGADRIAAIEALREGYTLQAPLPFARELYEDDFTDEGSRVEFRALLARATAVLELDSRRDRARVAYARVGEVVVAQSDILLAIWDGGRAFGAGGTADVVQRALDVGIPVIRIGSRAPHEVTLRGADADIDAAVHRILSVEDPVDRARHTGDHAAAGRRAHERRAATAMAARYYASRPPEARSLDVYGAFRRAVEGEAAGASAGVADPPAASPTPTFPRPVAGDYVRADRLAEHFGGAYRDSFVGNYLLAGGAVVAALIGFVWPVFALVELALISAIGFITYRGNRHAWHQRWIDFRLLAERLRVLEILLPIGRIPRSTHVPAYADIAAARRDWGDWLVRARARELGMTSARLDAPYLDAYRRFLHAHVADQAEYHRRTAGRSERLHHRVHLLATYLFWATFAICVVHVLADFVHLGNHGRLGAFWHLEAPAEAATGWNTMLTALAAALPAIGAALAGISSQAEFDRLARRSHSMSFALDALARRLDPARATPAFGDDEEDDLAQAAERAADAMTSELLDWQVTFRAKVLALPA